jgi:hypothetical protein
MIRARHYKAIEVISTALVGSRSNKGIAVILPITRLATIRLTHDCSNVGDRAQLTKGHTVPAELCTQGAAQGWDNTLVSTGCEHHQEQKHEDTNNLLPPFLISIRLADT